MKALKSELAKKLLSDLQASEQLREFLIGMRPDGIITLDGTTWVATIVPKAQKQ